MPARVPVGRSDIIKRPRLLHQDAVGAHALKFADLTSHPSGSLVRPANHLAFPDQNRREISWPPRLNQGRYWINLVANPRTAQYSGTSLRRENSLYGNFRVHLLRDSSRIDAVTQEARGRSEHRHSASHPQKIIGAATKPTKSLDGTASMRIAGRGIEIRTCK